MASPLDGVRRQASARPVLPVGVYDPSPTPYEEGDVRPLRIDDQGALVVSIGEGGSAAEIPVTQGAPTADASAAWYVKIVDAAGALFDLARDVTLAAVRDRLPAALTGGGGVRVGVVDALPAGSNTVGKVDQGTAGASAWKVDGSSVTQPVSAASLPLPSGAAQDRTTAAAPHAARLTDGAAFYVAARAGDAMGADLRVASAPVSSSNPVPVLGTTAIGANAAEALAVQGRVGGIPMRTTADAVNVDARGRAHGQIQIVQWGRTAYGTVGTPVDRWLWRGTATSGGSLSYYTPNGAVIVQTTGSAGSAYTLCYNTPALVGPHGLMQQHRVRVPTPATVGQTVEWGFGTGDSTTMHTTATKIGFRINDGVLYAIYRQPDIGGIFDELTIPRAAWSDTLDGSGGAANPSGKTLTSLDAEMYTMLYVGENLRYFVNDALVLTLAPGSGISPVPNPAVGRAYVRALTTSNSTPAAIYFGEVWGARNEAAPFAVVPSAVGRASAAVTVAAGTPRPILGARMATTLGGRPNAFRGLLSRLEIFSTQEIDIEVWYGIDGVDFTTTGGSYAAVPYTQVDVLRSNTFPAGGTYSITGAPLRLHTYRVGQSEARDEDLEFIWDEASRLLCVFGDGVVPTVLVTATRATGGTAADVTLINAQFSLLE